MKIALVLCGVIASLAFSGCQAPREQAPTAAVGGTSESGTGGQIAGHSESKSSIQDYREVLSSPGPFD